MLVNPPIQPPYIPRAPMKATIDGIPFSALPAKICRDSYTKVYQHMSLVLKRQLHLDSFKDISIPKLFAELHWIPLASFIRTAWAPIIFLFYLNIIEHDLDESYLKSSLFGIVVKVTSEVVAEVLGILFVDAPSMSELKVTLGLLDTVLVDL